MHKLMIVSVLEKNNTAKRMELLKANGREISDYIMGRLCLELASDMQLNIPPSVFSALIFFYLRYCLVERSWSVES